MRKERKKLKAALKQRDHSVRAITRKRILFLLDKDKKQKEISTTADVK